MTYDRINNFCLVFLTGFAFTAALIYTKPVLMPFVLALFTYSILAPVMIWVQQRFKVPRVIAIMLTLLGFSALATGVVFIMINSFEEFLTSAQLYKNRVIDLTQWIASQGAKWGVHVDDMLLREKLGELPALPMVKNLTGGIATLLGNASLVSVFVLFLIMGGGQGKFYHPLIDEIKLKISSYVAAKFFLSLVTGLSVGVVLFVSDVDMALLFTFLAFLLNFVPNIGPLIATALPLPIAFLEHAWGWQFFTVLIGTGLVQLVIGSFFEPKMLGESVDLHPITILFFLIFWGLVWGVSGMFLAVPITAVLKIVLSRIPTTQVFSEILAGRLQK